MEFVAKVLFQNVNYFNTLALILIILALILTIYPYFNFNVLANPNQI